MSKDIGDFLILTEEEFQKKNYDKSTLGILGRNVESPAYSKLNSNSEKKFRRYLTEKAERLEGDIAVIKDSIKVKSQVYYLFDMYYFKE